MQLMIGEMRHQSQKTDTNLQLAVCITLQAVAPVGSSAGGPNAADHRRDATPEPAAAVHSCSGAPGAGAAPRLPPPALVPGQHPARLLLSLQGQSCVDDHPVLVFLLNKYWKLYAAFPQKRSSYDLMFCSHCSQPTICVRVRCTGLFVSRGKGIYVCSGLKGTVMDGCMLLQ